MTDPVLYVQDGHIVTITLNRPEARNPCSDPDIIAGLLAALERLDADLSVRAAILTGAGTAFSSGGNLKAMEAQGGGLADAVPANTWRNYKVGIQRLPLAFEALQVPVIAAVNGPAIGAGCDLACMADIRIAGASARFAESFVKVGIVPGDGGAFLLPRVVGFSKAAEMALTGDSIDAAEALVCGLVSKVVPDAELLVTAHAVAGRIASNPPHAVRLTRRLLREASRMTLAQVLELSAGFQAMAHATADHKEALAAMLEKRQGTFRGE